MDIQKFIEELKSISVLELNELVKAIETEFGVSAAAPVAAAAGGAAPEQAAEEKTEFDVVLNAIGEKKVEVIKAVRALTGLGLVEAKNLVESAPCTVKEALPKGEANNYVEKLKEAGATASIK